MGYGMNSCLATPIIARFPLDTLYSYFSLLHSFACCFFLPHTKRCLRLPIYQIPGLPHYLPTILHTLHLLPPLLFHRGRHRDCSSA